jgi:hypothetical protein
MTFRLEEIEDETRLVQRIVAKKEPLLRDPAKDRELDLMLPPDHRRRTPPPPPPPPLEKFKVAKISARKRRLGDSIHPTWPNNYKKRLL